MSELDINEWVCPLPLRDYPNIVMAHGGGGKLSAELVENLFLPAFSNEALNSLSDSAEVSFPAFDGSTGRLAYSTDSFVVRPLFFRGGNIGTLAVNGTVNDVSMGGASPQYLSLGFIIEEGLPVADLGRIVQSIASEAKKAGVQIVCGDTKVVDRGKGDGLYINTSGIGVIRSDVNLSPGNLRPGDKIIVSGEIGLHGIAIMSQREGLEFDAPIESDCANLNFLVDDILNVSKNVKVLRDPTRGGIASALNELASASGVGILLNDKDVPVPGVVRSACELLGLDPYYVANEGKLIAVVAPADADRVVETMRANERGKDAAIVGEVTSENAGMVATKTAIGGTRIVDMQLGEQLPRIC